MFELIATIFAVYVLLAIAFPKKFIPYRQRRKKMVASNYWGFYDGTRREEAEHGQKIEVPRPARKHVPVAGSTMYAGKR